jgi:hypothetical protein
MVKVMIRQGNIGACLQSEGLDVNREEIFVNITLHRVPGELVREFICKVAVNYPGGISEAVQELMRRALKQ